MAAERAVARLNLDRGLQRRALQMLDEALEKPSAERTAFLRRACGREPELHRLAVQLLKADDGSSAAIPTMPPAPAALFNDPPERIGPYRITAKLGEGGMGDVYLGERDDGLFAQQVAVKLMRPTTLAETSLSYFERERRLLARLRHPNIAQLFDGGVDGAGRPYFIMERLEAAPITDYAAQLSLPDTLRLFLQVCEAVRHAHKNLIVHADIKPSNVLVDGEGAVKLVDFGVAQLIAGDEQGGRETQAFPITPAYASLQRRGGARPTPADDVYALGVLLFELVTEGVRPALSPVSPSAAMLALGGGHRRVRARTLQGDMDAVVLKAAATLPDDRYASVGDLSADVARWLERRPVAARPGGTSRAAWLFARRHPWASGAALAAALSVIAGLAVVTTLYLETREARRVAEHRFAGTHAMARALIFDLYPRLESLPRTLPVRTDLTRLGQAYLDELSAEPGAPVELKLEAVEGLEQLAGVQAGPGRPNLGETELARRNLDRAGRLATQLTHAAPGLARAWIDAAAVDIERATFAVNYDNAVKTGEAGLQAARRSLDRAQALAPGDPRLTHTRLRWVQRMSDNLQWQSRYAEAAAVARDGLRLAESLPPGPRAAMAGDAARLVDVLADAVYYGGDEKGSAPLYRRSLAFCLEEERRRPGDLAAIRAAARAQWQLGTTLVGLERSREALPILEAGVARIDDLLRADAGDMNGRRLRMVLRSSQAQALAHLKRFDEAVTVHMERVTGQRADVARPDATPQQRRDYALSLAALGDIYAEARRPREACGAYRDALGAWADVRRRGALSRLDVDYSLRLIGKSMAAARCEAAAATATAG